MVRMSRSDHETIAQDAFRIACRDRTIVTLAVELNECTHSNVKGVSLCKLHLLLLESRIVALPHLD